MIEINLLPGAGKKTRSAGPSLSLSGLTAGIATKIKDPLLASAIGSSFVAILAVGGMFWYQNSRTTTLAEQLELAEQDSIRYAAVIKEKRKAEAQRDSLLRQVSLIKSFDDKRFVWPHIMDEVSRALPPYTWLTSVSQTNTSSVPVEEPAPAGKAGGPAAVDSTSVPRVQLRIVGQTVDIQALTRFMRVLEASPFLENVQLVKSTLILVDGKDVTEFQLDASYERPDASMIRTVPITLSVR
jgi:Tfp pilus assembly protein PilN